MNYEDILENVPGLGMDSDYLEKDLDGCLCENECKVENFCSCLNFDQVIYFIYIEFYRIIMMKTVYFCLNTTVFYLFLSARAIVLVNLI